MSSGFKLTIASELRLEALPSDEDVVAAGLEVLEATNGWKKGKTYQKKTIQTYSRPKGPGDGAAWHCRDITTPRMRKSLSDSSRNTATMMTSEGQVH